MAATGTHPGLGFIHEDSGQAFVLDLADLVRDRVTIPVAFEGVRLADKQPQIPLERHVRRLAGKRLQREAVIPDLIDRIKDLFDLGHAPGEG